jgi:hypothetical protein
MDEEITFTDLIKPLWLRRYELIFSVLLITVLTFCSLYLLSEKINYDAEKIYHQDIRFNIELDQKYIQLLSNPDLIRKSYLENGLDPFDKEIVFDIINHSSRYDAMRENVVEGTAELFVKTLNIEIGEEERSIWEAYLNLDTTHHQLIFADANITEIESKIIISDIINRFNLMIISKNFLNSSLFPEIAFDQNETNLLYLNNRLQQIISVINQFREKFKENNFDADEVKYKSNVLMAHIFNKDPSPLITTLETLGQDIEQNASLKVNLQELHSKFYIDNAETSLTNTDTQLTVDSVSQLIDLGKDFSQLNNKMDLIDTIYDIDLNISSLEKSIFELNSIQKLYLNNYEPISLDQIRFETEKLAEILNYNIRLMNEKEYQQAVFTVGDIYIKKNNMLETNFILITILIIFAYSILHIISIYFRNMNRVK